MLLTKKLGVKLILFVCVVSTTCITVFAYVSLNANKEQMLQEVIKGASQLCETVRRTTRYDMLHDNRKGVYRIIKAIGDQPGIERVRIFNKEGKTILSTHQAEIGSVLPKDSAACYACHKHAQPRKHLTTLEQTRIYRSKAGYRVLGVITPIFNEKECYNADCHVHDKAQVMLGSFDIEMSIADVDEALEAAQIRVCIFAVVALLITAAVIACFIYNFVSRPVKNLLTAINHVASGDLDYDINIKSNDAFGEIARAFNKMTAELKKANAEIQQWAATLETKVQERTAKLRETQYQLIHSEKLASLGKLAATVAHEINNPISGVLTFTKLLLKICRKEPFPLEKRDDIIQYLTLMEKETARCGQIVKNLLAFSRRDKLEITQNDITVIIKHALLILSHKLRLQNIELHEDCPADLPTIECDATQIQQMLINIISNAIEAMPQGGKLSVSVKLLEDQDRLLITIADTGIGMSEEQRLKIFDPFFSTKEESKGVGLGLSIAYSIATDHGGMITVQSREGEGSIFEITLGLKYKALEDH